MQKRMKLIFDLMECASENNTEKLKNIMDSEDYTFEASYQAIGIAFTLNRKEILDVFFSKDGAREDYDYHRMKDNPFLKLK